MTLKGPERQPPVRTISGRAILWTDDAGTTHSCLRSEAVPGEFLVWTDCQIDVPPNEAHLAGPGEVATCTECRAATVR
ncbi:MAG: hypothetical protein K0S56_1002 [Microvirga sp.]|jgi:hypothetical protein|nr:hypothetical protein [Microvirga sp.]